MQKKHSRQHFEFFFLFLYCSKPEQRKEEGTLKSEQNQQVFLCPVLQGRKPIKRQGVPRPRESTFGSGERFGVKSVGQTASWWMADGAMTRRLVTISRLPMPLARLSSNCLRPRQPLFPLMPLHGLVSFTLSSAVLFPPCPVDNSAPENFYLSSFHPPSLVCNNVAVLIVRRSRPGTVGHDNVYRRSSSFLVF